MEAKEGVRFDVATLLQPTAPFTTARDVDACLETMRSTDANCCFTAAPVSEQPHWMFTAKAGGEFELLMPGHLSGDRQHAQNLPRYLHPSGAVWAVRAKALRETGRIYCAPMRVAEVAPERAIDIDTELDLVVAEAAARHFGLELAEPRRRVA
jgi:CMP-N-acetylneuraminic acid synthetase